MDGRKMGMLSLLSFCHFIFLPSLATSSFCPKFCVTFFSRFLLTQDGLVRLNSMKSLELLFGQHHEKPLPVVDEQEKNCKPGVPLGHSILDKLGRLFNPQPLL